MWRIRRRVLALRRRAREVFMLMHGLASTRHVLLVHIVPMRRCNLACSYCNESDKVSNPVALPEMLRRIDLLAAMGTAAVCLSGGEPLLHPDLDALIARIRRHGMIAGMITNGYLLSADRILRLNRAGLDHLQISIDNVAPSEVSMKSLKVLDRKLILLRDGADFHVNINSVLGGGLQHPDDALTVAHRAQELGFSSTVGILHDGTGQLRPLGPREQQVFAAIRALRKTSFARFNGFQQNLASGRENHWSCRAGARFLYVCEDGLVHYCSQQRGYPGIRLADYTAEHRDREFHTRKSCAPRCTVSCVNLISLVDRWHGPQTDLEPQIRMVPSAPLPARAADAAGRTRPRAATRLEPRSSDRSSAVLPDRP